MAVSSGAITASVRLRNAWRSSTNFQQEDVMSLLPDITEVQKRLSTHLLRWNWQSPSIGLAAGLSSGQQGGFD
jgi:hypothetical protein